MTSAASRVPEDARHEVKFVADTTRYHELERWILMNPVGFRIPYPPRQINNVYFDTMDLYAYKENLTGASARSKARLRWYGEHDHPEKTTLEIKRRHNHLGWKHHFPGGPMDFTQDRWGTIRRKLWDKLPIEGQFWLDAYPIPTLINRYHRQYFETPDGSVRATLDQRQRVLDQRLRVRPNLEKYANLPDTLVVEIKFQRANYAIGAEAIRGLPIRVSRNSKYVIGVQSMANQLGA
jgi:hypothetical protein